MRNSIKKVKKLIVAVIGFTVLGFGVLLIVLPGPAFIIIPLGLSILATEFLWARKILDRLKNKIKRKNQER